MLQWLVYLAALGLFAVFAGGHYLACRFLPPLYRFLMPAVLVGVMVWLWRETDFVVRDYAAAVLCLATMLAYGEKGLRERA